VLLKLRITCREMPGELEKLMVWFRDYKIPDGKPPNEFGFGNAAVDRRYADAVVQETHEAYKQLRAGACKADGDLCLC
jgi:inorganic pyrophosphatase